MEGETTRVTPAVDAAERARIRYTTHSYTHDPAIDAYAMEAAGALGIDAARVFKTLVVTINKDLRRLMVAVVPAAARLNLKALASAAEAKHAELADPRDAERATGYVIGGISPLGQRKRLPLFLDETALVYETVFVSGGRRGLEIELSPHDLLKLTGGKTVALARET